MKRIAKILRETEFESSSSTTKQFTSFYTIFKNEFKKEMEKIGCTDFEFHKGHFYISGFFNYKSNLFYFSLSDVRGMNYNNEVSLMYRTAEHRKDWTGGMNRWVTIGEDMVARMNLLN